jgi:hypothetical protein
MNLLICQPCDCLPVPRPGSMEARCHDCGDKIWVSEYSAQQMTTLGGAKHFLLVCLRCAPNHDDVENPKANFVTGPVPKEVKEALAQGADIGKALMAYARQIQQTPRRAEQ